MSPPLNGVRGQIFVGNVVQGSCCKKFRRKTYFFIFVICNKKLNRTVVTDFFWNKSQVNCHFSLKFSGLLCFWKHVKGTTLDEFGVKPNWAVVVDKSGKIEATGPSKEILERYSYEITRLQPSEILMPGFIDAHLHAPQFPNIG